MNVKKNTKSNTKNIQQTLNIKTAETIIITLVKKIGNDLDNSYLFRLYIKSFLLNKSLKINNNYEFNLFNNKHFLNLEKAKSLEGEINNDEQFTINEGTNIEIASNENDYIVNEITEKLSNIKIEESQEQMLKYFLENKKNYFYTNDQEEFIIVGKEDEIVKIKKIISLSIHGELNKFLQPNSKIPKEYVYKSILINGPSGIGKTHLINYIYHNYKNQINFFFIDLMNESINGDNTEDNEIKIKNTFKFAKLLAPSIIIFESIDRIFYKSDDDQESTSNVSSPLLLNDSKSKLILSFINELDNLGSSDRVLLLSTCSFSESIFPDLKKNGRLDYNLNLLNPSQKERKEYFLHFSNKFKHNLTEEDYEILADKSHGFVPGDIVQLFKETLININEFITRIDLENSLKNIKPINLKDIILDIPKVLWHDIGGNKDIIKKIRQSIEWPLKYADSFKRIGISPPNGILLYGPPGCSKTMIAKALATESGLNFFAIKGPELFSKYVGDTEKAVRDIFKKAKLSSPSIIFFDEIDSMANQRGSDSVVSDKVLCQLLNEMDGIESREKVVIFGATNRPDVLDKALIRPGRFDRLIYIPPPDKDGRKEIFRINLNKISVDDSIKIEELLQLTDGFSGAEINLACREAGMLALNEDISANSVKHQHLVNALRQINPIITSEMLKYFENFQKNSEL